MGCGGGSACARRHVASKPTGSDHRLWSRNAGVSGGMLSPLSGCGQGCQAARGGVICAHAAIADIPATLPPAPDCGR